MSNAKEYPIGIQNFEEIVSDNYKYIDKTEYLYNLVSKGKYYFLSRPRRFGKSLFASTLEAFFLGRRELFKGLAIDRHDDVEWTEYPVFHIDLNAKDYKKDDNSLFVLLDDWLRDKERMYGITPVVPDVDTRFKNLIVAASEKTGRKVVVIVDEYDSPLISTISMPERQELFRDTLKGFFGVLKSCDRYIRFAFLTGITKFGKVSVFSDLNNLEDITLDSQYNAICGISESEMAANFKEAITELGERYGLSYEEASDRMRKRYDGYHFTGFKSEGIYNPFSVLNVLKKREFSDYWFQTGTPTMLVQLVAKSSIDLMKIDGAMRTASSLLGINPWKRDLVPLLFQSGYLTITGCESDDGVTYYRLGFPNEEVERGFLNCLLPFYVDSTIDEGDLRISRFTNALRDKNVDEFMELLQSFMAGIPYGQDKAEKIHEDRFRDVLYIICRLMGLSVHAEIRTAKGRIDMTVETDRYIYIMEFKVDKSPMEAISQIEEKGYVLPYAKDGREVVKVGVEFSTAERNISGWEISC